VLPEGLRLIELHVRIPRHHVAMLRLFAERNRTTVGDALARELDGIASAQAADLSLAIAGFADVLAWPDGERMPLPC
jgi:hypothetical protein